MATILIVDDEPDITNMLSKVLRARGHHTEVARDGAQALARAASETFDLVLVDRNLPKVDGNEVCRRLRASAATRRIPVVMMTSSDIPFEDVGTPNGPDAWVIRPFLRQVLVANVERLLARA